MKRIFFLMAVLFALPFSLDAQCKAKQIAKDCKVNLKPFKYDGYATSELVFDDKKKTVEVEFTAFAGQDYKLIFCTSGFDEEVQVNIYDKRKTVKNRTKVYDSSEGIDNLFWSFAPKKSGTYYIEYEVPPSKDNTVKKGCVVLLIGFK